jgi:CubicO group peptidase (beta-lactamase class C family)
VITNKRPLLALAGFALCLLAVKTFGQAEPKSLTDVARLQTEIEPKITEVIKAGHLPRFAIGVVKNGNLIYAKGFGVAKLGGDTPITTKSLFHMASVTKTFVATAVMQLVEQGKIDLDAPVTKYLPYFKMDDERYRDCAASNPDATGDEGQHPARAASQPRLVDVAAR